MEKEYAVPAQGEIPYQYFEMQTNFAEDKWIQALEVRPGNRGSSITCWFTRARPRRLGRRTVSGCRTRTGPLSPTQMKELEEAKADPAKRRQCVSRWARRGILIAQIAPGTNRQRCSRPEAPCCSRPARC